MGARADMFSNLDKPVEELAYAIGRNSGTVVFHLGQDVFIAVDDADFCRIRTGADVVALLRSKYHCA